MTPSPPMGLQPRSAPSVPAAPPADGEAPRSRRPRWSWAYIAFRLGDGATSSLIALAVVLHYGLPLWALAVTTACMNLVGVPATFLWGAVVDRARHRRRVVVLGFAMAAGALALLATFPPFPLYVAGAMLYTMFGVATSPAASTLALQGVPRERWAMATSSLSRSTGLAFFTGMAASVALGFAFADPPFQAVFAASAAMCAVAALVAARTIPAALPSSGEMPMTEAVAAAGQRRFERPVFFPLSLFRGPTFGGVRAGLAVDRLLPLGILVTFMGSVCFFTSYPGVLSQELGLAAGLVLVCQAPSHIVSPLAYPWAARHGLRVGKPRGVAQGALLRLFGIPTLCGGIVLLGAPSVPLLIAGHAVMGLSFALIQVNGPLVLAEEHPGGKGQGVGLYHAALGAGTLLGSTTAFVLLRAFDYWVSYQVSLALTLAGVACLVASQRRGQARGRGSATATPKTPAPA
jgi:MFS family permease